MIIIDRELRGIGYQYYKYHCNIDGNEDWISNSNLKKGNFITISGNINDSFEIVIDFCQKL